MIAFQRIKHRKLSSLPSVSYAVLSIAVFASLAGTVGVLPAISLLVTLALLATLPGSSLVRRLFARPSLLHFVVIGTTVGLGLWAAGGMLSHITGLILVRWVPTAIGIGLWFLPKRYGRARVAASSGTSFPALGVLGAGLGVVALLPALRAVMVSEPVQWSGWYRFYTDLPFHAAIVGEVSSRAPQEFSWIANTELSYTWLFHSAMGVWGSLVNVPSVDLVFQVWPVLFTLLIPAAIALVAWEITGNRAVAAGAPLVYVLAHGLVFSPGEFQAVPLFQLSPTRDFADLFVLLVLLSLTKLLGHGSIRGAGPWWIALLAVSTFVATGAKGSAMPILLGGLLCAGLYLIVTRRVKIVDIVTFGVFVVCAALSYLLSFPDPTLTEALSIRPLTFLASNTPALVAISLALLGLLVVSILGMWIVVGMSKSGGWLLSTLLAGVLLAGVSGLGILDYPGASQNYFWQNAQPVFAIAIAWTVVLLAVSYGRVFVAVALSIFVASTLLWTVTQRLTVVCLGIAIMALVGAVIVARFGRESSTRQAKGQWTKQLFRIVVCAAVLTQFAQLISIPAGVAGGAVSTEQDSAAISSSQLAAFRFIRSHSAPADVVLTNKHCLSGSTEARDCDARWFALAAWTERRVFLEGWGYSPKGSSQELVQSQLDLGDRFINSPSVAQERKLLSMGIKYVYVDKREPFSTNLAAVSKLVFTSRWANVYLLGS